MSFSNRIPTFLLRLLALGATVSAAVVMLTSHDSAQVLNMNFKAKYTNSPTFKYFVVINAIAAGYTIILLFFPSKTSRGHLILVLDLIITLLLDSSLSACLAIGQVGKYGNDNAGWLPICKQVPKFCDHVTAAMVAAFVAALAYLLILLYFLHSVKNLTLTT